MMLDMFSLIKIFVLSALVFKPIFLGFLVRSVIISSKFSRLVAIRTVSSAKRRWLSYYPFMFMPLSFPLLYLSVILRVNSYGENGSLCLTLLCFLIYSVSPLICIRKVVFKDQRLFRSPILYSLNLSMTIFTTSKWFKVLYDLLKMTCFRS